MAGLPELKIDPAFVKAVEAAQETGFREGQQDAIRKILSALEKRLMEHDGLDPAYTETLAMVRLVAGLAESIRHG